LDKGPAAVITRALPTAQSNHLALSLELDVSGRCGAKLRPLAL